MTPLGARSLRQRIRLTGLNAAGAVFRIPKPAGLPNSVLLLRPDHVGDLLLLTPGLRSLREALPDAHITLAVGPWSEAVVQNNADVDNLVTIAFPGFERRPKASALHPYRLLRSEARRLRKEQFDAAVVLRFDHWWGAWLAALAGIPRRIGYDVPEVRPFLTQAVPYRPGRHEALQNAELIRALAPPLSAQPGPTRFPVIAADKAWAEAWLAEHGLAPHEKLVAVHPGAGAPVKQWPVGKWAVVAQALREQRGVRVLITGGPAEAGLAAELAARLPSDTINAVGQTSLGQLAALFDRCALVLGADSGPLHLAVAVGAATVHLYGPVPAAKFGPWGDPQRHVVLESKWACVPCDRLDWPDAALRDHGCIATMSVQRVIDAAISNLEGT